MTEPRLYSLTILTFILIQAFTYIVHAQDMTSVPWDTVVAEIKAIETSGVDDSTKASAMQDLFTRYQIDSGDYIDFTKAISQWPREEHRRFVENVKMILAPASQAARETSKKLVQPQKKPPAKTSK